jgi:hypothetical protein
MNATQNRRFQWCSRASIPAPSSAFFVSRAFSHVMRLAEKLHPACVACAIVAKHLFVAQQYVQLDFMHSPSPTSCGQTAYSATSSASLQLRPWTNLAQPPACAATPEEKHFPPWQQYAQLAAAQAFESEDAGIASQFAGAELTSSGCDMRTRRMI